MSLSPWALDRIRVLRRAAGAAGVLPDAAARHIESADRLAAALVAGWARNRN